MNFIDWLSKFKRNDKDNCASVMPEHGPEYYAKMFWNQVLPQIAEISTQSRYGYHGLSHTAQVAMFGIDIAYTIAQDPLPVILAAGLHDCARTNDNWCTEHGPHAVPVAREFLAKYYPTVPQRTVKQILNAVKNHTTGRHADNGIAACLWDGDRIRLSWEMGYDPYFFTTMRGRQIAALGPDAQVCYIEAQDSFLINNGILTREQIEYDREQDKIQNKIGTQFKSR